MKVDASRSSSLKPTAGEPSESSQKAVYPIPLFSLYFLVICAWMSPLGFATGSKTSTPPARPLPFSRLKAERLTGLVMTGKKKRTRRDEEAKGKTGKRERKSRRSPRVRQEETRRTVKGGF